MLMISRTWLTGCGLVCLLVAGVGYGVRGSLVGVGDGLVWILAVVGHGRGLLLVVVILVPVPAAVEEEVVVQSRGSPALRRRRMMVTVMG